MSSDQPKPTRPVSPPPPRPRRYDVTRSQVLSLAEQNAALQQRVDELERALDFRVKYTNAQKGAIETFTADNQRLRELLRRVDDAAERDDFGGIGVELLEQIKHAIGRTGE